MSEENQNNPNEPAKEAAPQPVPPAPPKLDPYLLFKQIEDLREEGFSEDEIRAAFNEFMAERHGEFRVPLKRIISTKDMIPMPSQDAINKMYEERVKGKNVLNEDIADLIAEVKRGTSARKAMNLGKKKGSFFKRAAYTAAYVLLKYPISFAVWILRKLGPGSDDDMRSSGFGSFREDS